MIVYLKELRNLTSSLSKSKKDMEQYYVTFSKIKFDVIYDISSQPFSLLIGAVGLNWGCTLNLERGFKTEMSDSIFYELCNILHLKAGKDKFTSFKFLKYIAIAAPTNCTNAPVSPEHLTRFRKSQIKPTDDPNKIYFKGWNNHLIDKRIAHNFDKTELFFGKKVADYCRSHNISSMWTDVPSSKKSASFPWD